MNIKPGVIVATPQGIGQAMNPCQPGHPERKWWVLFGTQAQAFPVGELSSWEGHEVFSSFSHGTGGDEGAGSPPSLEGDE